MKPRLFLTLGFVVTLLFVVPAQPAFADFDCIPWGWTGEVCRDDQICIIDCVSEGMPYYCYGACQDVSKCSDFGWTGTWPDCDMTPPPTCASAGYNAGTYPACYNVCANGSGGPYPACPITPTCTPSSACAAGTCPLDTCTATAADCSTYPVNGTNWAACIASCAPDTSCAASTCSSGSCTATAADCSTYSIPGTKTDGVCAPTCANGSPGPYPTCPLSCAPTSCPGAASICSGSTCTPQNADCSYGATVNGTMSCSATPIVSCSPSSQTIAAGGTATFSASAANGAGPTYTWEDAFAAVLGTGTPFPKVYSTAGSYAARVKASDGGGGFVYSTYCNVTVTGGACDNSVTPTLTASKTRLQTGVPTTVTFTMNTTKVTGGNCTLSGPGMTTQTYVPSSCSVTGATYSPTLTLTEQSTYTFSCPGGQFAKVIINIVPKFREF